MKKSELFELRKYVGDLSTVFGIKDHLFNDGPARGVRAFDVRNGKGLSLTVMADRGMDIPFLRYKGVNVGFASKTGVRAPQFYVEEGVRGFLKQFNGGLLTTCGITYAGAPSEDDGRVLGLHGPYSNLPAENVLSETVYEGDEAVLRLSGSVREACVFNENMLLHREILVGTERSVVRLTDRVENQGFAESPVMLVYHVNFGYPLLDAGARVYSNAGEIVPRDALAREGLDKYDLIEEPGIDRAEQCYFHVGMEKDGFAMLHNEKLGIAAIVRFDAETFPLLCEWKCMRAGDYALGLEPTTSGVAGRADARSKGMLGFLKPGEAREYAFELEMTDDIALIGKYRAMAK